MRQHGLEKRPDGFGQSTVRNMSLASMQNGTITEIGISADLERTAQTCGRLDGAIVRDPSAAILSAPPGLRSTDIQARLLHELGLA